MLGILGRKMGMAQVFQEDGKFVPVTFVRCEPNVIADLKTQDRDGYTSVVLGFEDLGDRATKTRKFRVTKEIPGDISAAEVGSSVLVSIFEDGEEISIVGVSKGKGFQGRVRRHNARVARKTHGTKYIRHGSSGALGITARAQKGLKMPGRMGGDQVTLHGRKIVRVDVERNLIAVKGGLPGAINSLVLLKKSS